MSEEKAMLIAVLAPRPLGSNHRVPRGTQGTTSGIEGSSLLANAIATTAGRRTRSSWSTKPAALLSPRPSSLSRDCAVITAACGRKHVGTCGRGASSLRLYWHARGLLV